MSADDPERLRHMLAAALAVVKEIEIIGGSCIPNFSGRQACRAGDSVGEGYGDEEPSNAWIFQLGPGGNLDDAGNQSSCVGRAANE